MYITTSAHTDCLSFVLCYLNLCQPIEILQWLQKIQR